MNDDRQVKVLLRQFKLIIFELCQVQKVVYEVFHHLLGEYLLLQDFLRFLSCLLDRGAQMLGLILALLV